MKALTLTQPWASLMATINPGTERPWKTIETRSWPTSYRGEIVIHAAKGMPRWAKDICNEPWFAKAVAGVGADNLPRSVGVCVVRVVGCVRTDEMHKAEFILGRKPDVSEIIFGDYSAGRYAWLTEFVRVLDPASAPVRGALSLWDWPGDLLSRSEVRA